jgi:transcriptional regulator with AAA-type ATPase domain
LDAAANLGVGTAAVGALVALSRLPARGGMLVPPAATRSWDAAAFTAVLWGVAAAVPATRAVLQSDRLRLDPLTIDYATTSAGVGTLMVLVAATWRLRVLSKLEIGISDRAAGALALTLTAFAVAVPAAALNLAAPDRVLPLSVLLASVACVWTAMTKEPTTVSSALRGILAVMILGAPTTLVAGLLARGSPDHAGAVVLGACAVSIGVGLVARAVARPLGPEQSRWLDSIDAATQSALQPEPDEAIRSALNALSRATSTPGAKAELWRTDPEQRLFVDIAGYLHVERASAPDRIYELAELEPERTVRAEVLQAIQVRRPDVRSSLAWFEAHRAFSATVVVDEQGPVGFILLPRGNRTAVMTLEEARAVRLLADRISALLAVSSALARSRERELAAVSRADRLDAERQRYENVFSSESGRHRAVAERAARVVRSTAYGSAARMAIEKLERLGRNNLPVALRVPAGVDAAGWAALVHLASPRQGAFMVVDGASGSEHDLSLWRDELRSPWRLADGGSLVVLDLPALPEEIQKHLFTSSALPVGKESKICPPGLIAAVRRPLEQLLSEGRLYEPLARWLKDGLVEIPSLGERPEDLRAIALDTLARAGLATRGAPLGIEDSALRLLMEHNWPGNDLELYSLLTRAAQLASGPALTFADLSKAGLVESSDPAHDTPLPTSSRRLRARGFVRK